MSGPGEADSFLCAPEAGHVYEIDVLADGESVDFDVFVHDENGNAVASDVSSLADCSCIVSPEWTGPFTIEVLPVGVDGERPR